MLYGMPIGTATLEATNDKGEVRIITRVTTNDVISGFYPMDNSVDTRLINGNYLLTRIRQHEGNFVSDTGFTLMLREKKVFWVDRLRNRYDTQPLPREDVMDIISAGYYLRNRHLEVGKPVVLNLYDNDQYTPTTVEVLRKEHLHLPAFREVDTLVIHPVLKTAGIFRQAKDVLAWVTDDASKVPVRLETTLPVGWITAELVAAESN